MEQIVLDTGVRCYQLGLGQLRMHPGDPNLYIRFARCAQQLETIAQRQLQALKDSDQSAMALAQVLSRTDGELKALLNEAFGAGNDFDEILGGVNLLAPASDGRQVLSHLLDALVGLLQEGAEVLARQQEQLALDRLQEA